MQTSLSWTKMTLTVHEINQISADANILLLITESSNWLKEKMLRLINTFILWSLYQAASLQVKYCLSDQVMNWRKI